MIMPCSAASTASLNILIRTVSVECHGLYADCNGGNISFLLKYLVIVTNSDTQKQSKAHLQLR